MDVRGISLAQRPVKLHRVTGGVRVHTDVRYTLPGHSRVKEGRPRPTHFSEPIPAHRSTRRLSVGIGPVGTPRYLPGTAAYRLGPPRSTVHAHIHTHTPTTDWRVDTPTGTGHHGTPHERTNTSLTGSPRPDRVMDGGSPVARPPGGGGPSSAASFAAASGSEAPVEASSSLGASSNHQGGTLAGTAASASPNMDMNGSDRREGATAHRVLLC